MALICDMAKNCRCDTEPEHKEFLVRMTYDPYYSPTGWISDLHMKIKGKMMEGFEVYGQKDPAYNWIIPNLYKEMECKFIHLVRDPYDTIRSLLNWNQQTNGITYNECQEPVQLSEKAAENKKANEGQYDQSDMIRPRPGPHEPLFLKWKGLTRAEMYAFYWRRSNEIIRNGLSAIPGKLTLHMNNASLAAELIDFLGLNISEKDANQILTARVNSTENRGFGTGTYPVYEEWDQKIKDRVERILWN